MSATAAIAASSAAQSTAAEQDAREAKKIACGGFMRGYEDATASIGDKKQYASCVNMTYPNQSEMAGGDIFAVKMIVLVTIIGALWGGYKGFQERDGIVVTFLYSLFGAVMLPTGIAFVCAIIWGITFLF